MVKIDFKDLNDGDSLKLGRVFKDEDGWFRYRQIFSSGVALVSGVYAYPQNAGSEMHLPIKTSLIEVPSMYVDCEIKDDKVWRQLETLKSYAAENDIAVVSAIAEEGIVRTITDVEGIQHQLLSGEHAAWMVASGGVPELLFEDTYVMHEELLRLDAYLVSKDPSTGRVHEIMNLDRAAYVTYHDEINSEGFRDISVWRKGDHASAKIDLAGWGQAQGDTIFANPTLASINDLYKPYEVIVRSDGAWEGDIGEVVTFDYRDGNVGLGPSSHLMESRLMEVSVKPKQMPSNSGGFTPVECFALIAVSALNASDAIRAASNGGRALHSKIQGLSDELVLRTSTASWSIVDAKEVARPSMHLHLLPGVSSPLDDKPLAAEGLQSYRCKGVHGWIMVGGKDDGDAMREALRSSKHAKLEDLQKWDGSKYVSATALAAVEPPNAGLGMEP